MPTAAKPRLVLDDLVFPESPRWHDGALWLSDMFGYQLVRLDADGTATTVGEFDDCPSGSGFLPDGSFLLALRNSRQIVRYADGAFGDYLDLSSMTDVSLNDMVVDGGGRAYVGVIGAADRGASASDSIVSFEPDRAARVVASGLASPNGMAISPDAGTLFVSSTWRSELLAFDIAANSSLSGGRRHAQTGTATPDGLCLDAEGALWVAGLGSGTFLRVLPGGEVSHTIDISDRWALACTLGGVDRRTLYLASSKTNWPVDEATRGYLHAVDVDVAGAGWP